MKFKLKTKKLIQINKMHSNNYWMTQFSNLQKLKNKLHCFLKLKITLKRIKRETQKATNNFLKLRKLSIKIVSKSDMKKRKNKSKKHLKQSNLRLKGECKDRLRRKEITL